MNYRPHIADNGSGCSTLEWWNDKKKLTLYLMGDLNVVYVCSWGVSMEHEMKQGVFTTDDQSKFKKLWDWLWDAAAMFEQEREG